MPDTALRKNRRSSLLVNPASWDVLFSRMSITLRTPALSSRPKNFAAGFFTIPMVKSVISSIFSLLIVLLRPLLFAHICDSLGLSVICALDKIFRSFKQAKLRI